MSRRHQMALKLAAYGEVRSILAAMKNVALAELHKLAGLRENQRRAMETIERATDDFVAFHPLPRSRIAGSVSIVIGSERGFCGEFNEPLAQAARARRSGGERVLVVGTRLMERFPDPAGGDAMPGATVAEELPALLERVAAWIEAVQSDDPDVVTGVTVLHHDPESVRLTHRVLFPLPLPETAIAHHTTPPQLNMPPAQFIAALVQQALMLLLHEVFSVSLIAENRRRLEHMQGALLRLDEISDALTRRMNTYRQEEITQEIEVIMLSADALMEEEAARVSSSPRHVADATR